MSKRNPFDYISALSGPKQKDLISLDMEEHNITREEAESDYNPFLVNRSFSYFPDTVLYANEMNTYSFLPKTLQNDFYLNSLRPRKRWAKWAKSSGKKDIENIQIISEYYQMSVSKAQEVLDLFSLVDLKVMADFLHPGGMVEGQSPRTKTK